MSVKQSISIEDVKVTTSLTFKGQIAHNGFIYFIMKAKAGGREFTKAITAKRTNATPQQEQEFIRKLAVSFRDVVNENLASKK